MTRLIEKNVVHSYVRNIVRENGLVSFNQCLGMDARFVQGDLKNIYNDDCVNDDIQTFAQTEHLNLLEGFICIMGV